MTSSLFQRRGAFLNNANYSSPLSPHNTIVESPAGVRSQLNGSHLVSPKELNRTFSSVSINEGTPMVAKKFSSVNVKELHGSVGFANIPNQVFRKAAKEGFEFTIMVVGQSGLGKSTFLNSLFSTDFKSTEAESGRNTVSSERTLRINERTMRLVENSISLNLTLVDTPGFGDAVDNSNCWEPIIEYVDKKFYEYFREETKIYRKDHIPDTRVHCCLYFIAPTGHDLKPLDIEFMKYLHDRVNIIPVISKADTMTAEERIAFKKIVAQNIADHRIKIYEFPEIDNAWDQKEYQQYKDRVPFAVVGSSSVCELPGGKKGRCRKYPWGIVEVDSLEHNDFVALRNTMIRACMIDLIRVTRFVHYENYRVRQLTPMDELRRQTEMRMNEEAARQEQVEQTLRKEQAEGLEKLKQQEDEVNRYIEQLKREMEAKRRQLDTRRAAFLQEKSEFAQQYPEFQKHNSGSSLNEKEKLKKKRSVFSRDSNVSSISFRNE